MFIGLKQTLRDRVTAECLLNKLAYQSHFAFTQENFVSPYDLALISYNITTTISYLNHLMYCNVEQYLNVVCVMDINVF